MGNCWKVQPEPYIYRTDSCNKNETSSHFQQHKAGKQVSKHYGKSFMSACILGGLVNIGNTCYMNSGLQCLFHTNALRIKILFQYKGEFISQYKSVYEKIKYSQPSQPKQLKRLIQNYNPQFKGNRQNDAGELVSTVINLIAQETNQASSRVWSQIKSTQDESDDKLCNKYIKRDQQRSNSVIDQIITGMFKTTYRCANCNKEERLFEKFNLIYLPIPQRNNLKLQDCISQFSRLDILSSWNCNNCQKDCEHMKTMSIFKPNKILIFSLKRFTEGGRKNKAHVDIPSQLSLQQLVLEKQVSSKQIYELYAVIKHVGHLQAGHYSALCFNQVQKRWFYYNDQIFSPISDEMLKQSQRNASIVFYRLKEQSHKNPQAYITPVPV